MTSTNNECRQALRKLASQACSNKPAGANPAHASEKKGGKVVGLVVAGLAAGLGWTMYSHWMQSSHADQGSPATTDGAVQTSTPTAIASTPWVSTRDAANASPGPSTPTRPTSTAKTVTAARDGNLEARVEPVEALARRGDPKAVPAVLDALNDDDWRVRSRVIDAAVNAYVAIPESALIEHAQSDPSPEVRFLALAGIAARLDPALPQVDPMDPNTARAIGRQALNDASEEVRWQAQEILDALDSKEVVATNEPSQPEVL